MVSTTEKVFETNIKNPLKYYFSSINCFSFKHSYFTMMQQWAGRKRGGGRKPGTTPKSMGVGSQRLSG